MPCRIHALMQDPDHVHAVSSHDVENEMAADAVATVPLTNLIAIPSTLGVARDPFNSGPNLRNIGFGLRAAICVS